MADLKDFHWGTLWEGVLLSKWLYWMKCRAHLSATFKIKNYPKRSRTHQDIEVFHCNFSDFADFEDFNWPALQEGAVCSWTLYEMDFRRDCGLESRRNRFRFAQGLMEIFKLIFRCNFTDFAHFEDLTGQRLRKERSVHAACIGWMLEGIERLNSVKTDLDSHRNLCIYIEVFHYLGGIVAGDSTHFSPYLQKWG